MIISVQCQQVLNLFALLLLGKYTAHLYLSWPSISVVLIFSVVFEHALLYYRHKSLDFFSFSSLTTAIGVVLMMASPQLWIYCVVIGLGLLQKHFLTIDQRHFFNPSNFSLLLGLCLFYEEAHMVLGQLGDAFELVFLLVILAVAMLIRVRRWVIPLAFSACYLLLQYLWVVPSDPVMIFETVTHRFYSVSFVLFILFMLTDPKTTPTLAWQQLVFAFLLALLAVLLDWYQGFRVQHLFMALFIVSSCVPLWGLEQTSPQRKKLRWLTLILIILAFIIIGSIESQAPYYFAMDS